MSKPQSQLVDLALEDLVEEAVCEDALWPVDLDLDATESAGDEIPAHIRDSLLSGIEALRHGETASAPHTGQGSAGLFDSAPHDSRTIKSIEVPSAGDLRFDLNALVTKAYLSLYRLLPEDHVVLDPIANQEFIARCRALGASVPERRLNHTLLNLRKAKAHSGIEREKPCIPDREVRSQVAFASEIAARLVQWEVAKGEDFSLDRIFCDPKHRGRFDEFASQIKPGFDTLEYRLAALAERKNARRRSQRVAAAPMPKLLRVEVSGNRWLRKLPEEPGVYLIDGPSCPLYAGTSLDLRERMALHLESGGRSLVPVWTGLFSGEPVRVYFVAGELLGTSAMRTEVRSRLRSKYLPCLNFRTVA